MTTHFNVSVLPISRCGDILLGTKARGFGEGKICGFGGKVESFDASIEAAASRELAEELNLINTPPLSRRGLLLFTFQPDRFAMEVHVFSCELDRGLRSNPSDEFLKPLQWYSRHENSLPYESMVSFSVNEIFWICDIFILRITLAILCAVLC